MLVLKRIGYMVLVGVLLVGYQNCSMQASHKGAQDISSLSKTCENAIAVTYRETYYSTFRTACTSCHASGGEAQRPFADANFDIAFESFRSIGRSKIEFNATNPGHKAPRTGVHLQPLIDNAKSAWLAAESLAATCQRGSEIQTVKKTLPANVYSATFGNTAAWPQVSYNLSTEVANTDLLGKLPLTVTVEVRRYIPTGTTAAVAYELKNPRVSVQGTAPLPSFRIQGIKIVKNDVTVNDFTFFENIDAVVNSATATLLMGASNWAALWGNPVASDQLALKFLAILDGSGLPITTTPITPGPTPNLPARVSYADLVGSNAQLNVFARACNSCHSGASPSAALNMTVYSQAQASALLIQSRMNNQANPMPRNGLLSATDRALVDIWISSGSPQQ